MIYYGDTTAEPYECDYRYVWNVIYEKPEDSVEKYSGLLVATVSMSRSTSGFKYSV